MIFKRSVQRYGRTPEPETPFQRAGQLWDERIGSARVQARNWRLMAFGSLTLSGGLASGLAWLSLQSRVVPYVVEVDRLGAARSVAPLQPRRQAGSVPSVSAHVLHLGVELIDQGGQGQAVGAAALSRTTQGWTATPSFANARIIAGHKVVLAIPLQS